jgi:hypothetical protein
MNRLSTKTYTNRVDPMNVHGDSTQDLKNLGASMITLGYFI